jgi:hypothetical protein
MQSVGKGRIFLVKRNMTTFFHWKCGKPIAFPAIENLKSKMIIKSSVCFIENV